MLPRAAPICRLLGGRPRTRRFAVLVGPGALLLAVCLLAAADGLVTVAAPWRWVVLVLLAVVPVLRPLWGAALVFFAIPFFGNQPGGRFVELQHVLLAATILGLALLAWRRQSPAPGGPVWWAAWTYVAAAGLALVPTAGRLFVRWIEIHDLRLFAVQTLAAPESDPLYSIQSLVLLALAVAWGAALAWARVDLHAIRRMLDAFAISFVVVIAVGILDYHGVVSLRDSYFTWIDSADTVGVGFRSIFWNPGWYAWYFVSAVGVVLAAARSGGVWRRGVYGLALVAGCLYLPANPQRAAIVTLAVVLAAIGAHWLWRGRLGWTRVVTVGLGVLLVTLVVVMVLPRAPSWLASMRRATEVGHSERLNLAHTAVAMWLSAPTFGIGEGAFAWRYAEWVPSGSPRWVWSQGDAHNTWLQVLATRGLVGLAVYLALLALIAKLALGVARVDDPRVRSVASGAVLSLLGLVTYSCFQYVFYVQGTQVFFWGVVGWLAALAATPSAAAASHESRDPAPSARARRRWLVPAALGLLGLQLVWSWPTLARDLAGQARRPRGFYPVEVTGTRVARWSSSAGALCLYPSSPYLRLTLARPGRPVVVSLDVDGRPLDTVDLALSGTTTRVYYLEEAVGRLAEPPAAGAAMTGAGASSGRAFGECGLPGPALRLGVTVSDTYRPRAVIPAGDPRHLGVAVSEPEFLAPGAVDETGLWPWERSDDRDWRWTAARASLVTALTADSARLTLPVRATTPLVRWLPTTVRVFWNGRPVAVKRLSDTGWHELTVDVTAANRWGVVSVQVDRTWQPKAWRHGSDRRHLGVQLGTLVVVTKGARE